MPTFTELATETLQELAEYLPCLANEKLARTCKGLRDILSKCQRPDCPRRAAMSVVKRRLQNSVTTAVGACGVFLVLPGAVGLHVFVHLWDGQLDVNTCFEHGDGYDERNYWYFVNVGEDGEFSRFELESEFWEE